MAEKLELVKRLKSRNPVIFSFVTIFVCCISFGQPQAADLAEARATFNRGDYQECIKLTRAEVATGIWNDVWSRQLIQALLATGEYAEACAAYEQVAERFSKSISLRVLAAEAYRFDGQHEKGDRLLAEIPVLVQNAPWQFSDRDNLLAIGKFLLTLGEDARLVLDAFFDRSLKADPKFVEVHMAIAELALDKADYQEAVKSLDVALELRPEDPQIRFLLAKAWAASDATKATANLKAALDLNPRHADSLLMQAENLINSENYADARELLAAVLEVNPKHPIAWALEAAIAHLQGDYRREGECRKSALATWQLNPQIDFVIGKTLSQHYRFAEGVKYQRRALQMVPSFLPSRFQLAQDLLRVGQDDEGWTIVDQVSEADKYNVVAFNLKTLRDRLASFATLEEAGFIIRMDAREAKIYGPRVVALLLEAKHVLTAKYEYELTTPVTVEIFPQQSDFAIRTFGLPGGAGFLGVCFGSLITANSPASQGDTPSNWESVLWHEFCHVITLQKTNNRMPRWLSEGISVYEELQRDESWGQSMSPMYKDMLLGEDFVPLSELSGAFLSPKSPMHLQFAYFESSLAVRYLVQTHGLPLLRKLLVDLGAGLPASEAFERLYGDAEILDEGFELYVQELAGNYLPETDFERDGLPARATVVELADWLGEHPSSYVAQRLLTTDLAAAKKWPEALQAARKLLELYPDDTESGGALDLLATTARETGDSVLERTTLEQLTGLSSDNLPGLLRLIVLNREAQDWPSLSGVASKLLAVQPLIVTGHEALVESSRQLNQPEKAIGSLRALKEMEPVDPAALHFNLSQMLVAADRPAEAREEVLLALEHSPRYRDAQKLLVKIHKQLNPVRPAQSTLEVVVPEAGVAPRPR